MGACNILIVPAVIVCMYVLHNYRAPNSFLTFPKSLEELRALSATLQLLKNEHFYGVLALFAAAYLYKQTFAIPGSVFLVINHGTCIWVGSTECTISVVWEPQGNYC